MDGKETEKTTEQGKKTEGKKRRKPYLVIQILGVLFALMFVTFCYATYHLAKDLISDRKDQQGFDELSAIVAADTQNAPASSADTVEITQPAEEESEETEYRDQELLGKYITLSEMNPEFFGWLYLEGLGINYPVMFSPDRPQYYLNRDFYGVDSVSGIPFMDERCSAGGNFYLIYGHLMQNKSIFGRLPEYADYACWRENPTFRFDTLTEEREYAVMACFYSRIYYEGEPGFRYYDYCDLSDENVFNYYVSQAKAESIYDTGVTAVYGDEIMVLSTCSHHTEEGRFAVVAKRIK
ncbi:MAG: class B sortase [Oscillospiraceae bacterium]|nr:class B sortase [Oscillospiraceae bacterium]